MSNPFLGDTFGTHDGKAHADDMFSWVLLLMLGADPGALIRTRDPELLAQCDLVFDVGHGKYDHHQPGGNGMRENGIKYASFGLLWREYGPILCNSFSVAARVDRMLVQSIDAQDNGQRYAQPGAHREVSISDVMLQFNPTWLHAAEDDQDLNFLQGAEFARIVLRNAIRHAWAEEKAYHSVCLDMERGSCMAFQAGRVYTLSSNAPWAEAVCEDEHAMFVIYGENERWTLHAVPPVPGSQQVRKKIDFGTSLPDGCMFLHNDRFIAIFDTQGHAIEAACLIMTL